jgi:hypothetical protein
MKNQKLLIELDKAGAEWVVVAYLSGDGQMLKVLRSDRSPHVITGSLISGCPQDLVEKESKLVGFQTDPTLIEATREKLPELQGNGYFIPRTMSVRQAGKKANHGLNYGLGYKTFALYNEMEERDAKEIVRRYHEDAYPSIRQWHEKIKRQLNDNRTLTNCFGRKRKFYDAWGMDLWLDAYSFIPQSTVVDMVNIGMTKAFNDKSLDFQLLAQVHDSILIQVPPNWEKAAQDCKKIALDYMMPTVQYGAREFQILTDIKVGLDWSVMREIDVTSQTLAQDIREAIETIEEETR